MRRWQSVGSRGNSITQATAQITGASSASRPSGAQPGLPEAGYRLRVTQAGEPRQRAPQPTPGADHQASVLPTHADATAGSAKQLVDRVHSLRSIQQVRHFLAVHGEQLDSSTLVQLYIRLRHIYLNNPSKNANHMQREQGMPSLDDASASASQPTATGQSCSHEAETALWQHLDIITHRERSSLQVDQWSLLAYTLAKSKQRRSTLLNLIVAHTSINLPSLAPDGLVNIIWSLAELGHQPDEEWLQCFLLASQPRLAGLKAGMLVNMLWALGKLQAQPSDSWMAAAMQAVEPELPTCTPSQLANIAWALAEIGYLPAASWMQQYSAAAARQLPKFKPHLLATLMASLLKLQYKPGSVLLSAIRQQVADVLPAFRPTQLSVLLWAMGKMDARASPYWLDLVAEQIQLQLRRSSTREMAAMVWALPRLAYPCAMELGAKHGRLLRDVARLTELQLHGCSAGELVQLVEGFARLGFYPGVGWIASHETACAALGHRLGGENRAKVKRAYEAIWTD